MGDGLQYPTVNHDQLQQHQQHHSNPTSYHSMDDTRNRFEIQPTDKLINHDNASPATIAVELEVPLSEGLFTRSIVPGDIASAASVHLAGEANGSVIIAMDDLNKNQTTAHDLKSSVIEVHNMA